MAFLSTVASPLTAPRRPQHHHSDQTWSGAIVAAFLGISSAVTLTLAEESNAHGNYKDPKQPGFNVPPPRPDLPIFSLDEVAEHNDEDSLWYTFRGGVYDMTSFLNGHPGGTPVSETTRPDNTRLHGHS